MRKWSFKYLDIFRETKRNDNIDSDVESPTKAKRRSNALQTLEYLKTKAEIDAKLRKEELELRE